MRRTTLKVTLRRRPTYQELIGVIDKDFPIRLPDRRALQIEASPELQQLKDSLDDTNLFLKRQTREQEVAARVREAAGTHGINLPELQGVVQPPAVPAAPPPGGPSGAAAAYSPWGAAPPVSAAASSGLQEATEAALRAQQWQLEAQAQRTAELGHAFMRSQDTAARAATALGEVGGLFHRLLGQRAAAHPEVHHHIHQPVTLLQQDNRQQQYVDARAVFQQDNRQLHVQQNLFQYHHHEDNRRYNMN